MENTSGHSISKMIKFKPNTKEEAQITVVGEFDRNL